MADLPQTFDRKFSLAPLSLRTQSSKLSYRHVPPLLAHYYLASYPAMILSHDSLNKGKEGERERESEIKKQKNKTKN